MSKFDELNKEVKDFVDERNWNQFHSPENLAKSIAIEAGELLECFQRNGENYNLQDVKDELADVFVYCVQMSQVLNLDLIDVAHEKMKKNKDKYPVEKAKNNATKYDKL